jgi:hypothetical protein
LEFDSMLRRRLVLLGAALLGACSPELNWREVRTPEAGVEQLFPCKPVRQQRKAELAGKERQLVLQVCDAGDVTWAQMHVLLHDKDAIGSSMEALVAAAHANLGAAPAPAPASASASGSSGIVTESSGPSSAQRYRIKGTAPDGRPVEMALKVFGNGSVVVQVSALASVLPTEAVDTFLGSVKVQP